MNAKNRAQSKILSFLTGTIHAALNQDPEHSWIYKDANGDKIPVEERGCATEEALRFIYLLGQLQGDAERGKNPESLEPAYRAHSDGQLKEMIQRAWEELQEREVIMPGLGLQKLLDDAADSSTSLYCAIDGILYRHGHTQKDEEEARRLADRLRQASEALIP
jgi:hypothetical protein